MQDQNRSTHGTIRVILKVALGKAWYDVEKQRMEKLQ